MPAKRKSKPRSPDHAALGKAIELLIAENANMSQRSVASDGGLDVRQVNDFARGQGNPTFETMVRLCDGLHVSLGELMTKADAFLEMASGASPRGSEPTER
jgi:transcriptional regulator with XRE-family HTH domain